MVIKNPARGELFFHFTGVIGGNHQDVEIAPDVIDQLNVKAAIDIIFVNTVF